jgi:hypothetical protein
MFIHISAPQVLFLGLDRSFATYLTFLLTGLNALMKALNLGVIEQQHTAGRIAFASVQRSLATVLTMDSYETIASRFMEFSKTFKQTEEQSRRLQGVEKFKKQGPSWTAMFNMCRRDPLSVFKAREPLFELITDQALLDEAQLLGGRKDKAQVDRDGGGGGGAAPANLEDEAALASAAPLSRLPSSAVPDVEAGNMGSERGSSLDRDMMDAQLLPAADGKPSGSKPAPKQAAKRTPSARSPPLSRMNTTETPAITKAIGEKDV